MTPEAQANLTEAVLILAICLGIGSCILLSRYGDNKVDKEANTSQILENNK